MTPLFPDPKSILFACMQAALEAADAYPAVQNALKSALFSAELDARMAGGGRLYVIGAGKAAARMAQAVEQLFPDIALTGVVVTRYGHAVPCERIRVIEASHPVPDAAGLEASNAVKNLVQNLAANDTVIALISGGGSSLLCEPIAGIAMADKQLLTNALLRCGATIHEINCVRQQLSAIKGGKLGALCGAAWVHTLVVSDVPGDDPCVVASGPTLSTTGTKLEARTILQRYGIAIPVAVDTILNSPTFVAIDKTCGKRSVEVITTAQQMLQAASRRARELGVTPITLGDTIEGEARDVGAVLAGVVKQIAHFNLPIKKPAIVFSGGEASVTLRAGSSGRGGRNTEYLLGHLHALRATLAPLAGNTEVQVYGLAIDTDGIDGSEDNAGAFFTPDTLIRAKERGEDARARLDANDAYSFFAALDQLVITGPTLTNVNDFRATLIL